MQFSLHLLAFLWEVFPRVGLDGTQNILGYSVRYITNIYIIRSVNIFCEKIDKFCLESIREYHEFFIGIRNKWSERCTTENIRETGILLSCPKGSLRRDHIWMRLQIALLCIRSEEVFEEFCTDNGILSMSRENKKVISSNIFPSFVWSVTWDLVCEYDARRIG